MGEERKYTTIHPEVHARAILTQLNIREGLLAFGEKGNKEIFKGIEAIAHKMAPLPVQKGNMTHDKRKGSLRYLMFLKEKHDG